jgi:hypothetical protein
MQSLNKLNGLSVNLSEEVEDDGGDKMSVG